MRSGLCLVPWPSRQNIFGSSSPTTPWGRAPRRAPAARTPSRGAAGGALPNCEQKIAGGRGWQPPPSSTRPPRSPVLGSSPCSLAFAQGHASRRTPQTASGRQSGSGRGGDAQSSVKNVGAQSPVPAPPPGRPAARRGGAFAARRRRNPFRFSASAVRTAVRPAVCARPRSAGAAEKAGRARMGQFFQSKHKVAIHIAGARIAKCPVCEMLCLSWAATSPSLHSLYNAICRTRGEKHRTF